MNSRNDYEDELHERWETAAEKELPEPWRALPVPHMGGLIAVGLDAQGDYLLSISHDGRGVIDCRTGEKVARDYDDDWSKWLYNSRLVADGIGPLAGEQIRVAGSFIGGGLPAMTEDGWHVETWSPNWTRNDLVWYNHPYENGYRVGGRFYKLWEWDPPFAYGYSESGLTLVVACSNEVCIWRR